MRKYAFWIFAFLVAAALIATVWRGLPSSATGSELQGEWVEDFDKSVSRTVDGVRRVDAAAIQANRLVFIDALDPAVRIKGGQVAVLGLRERTLDCNDLGEASVAVDVSQDFLLVLSAPGYCRRYWLPEMHSNEAVSHVELVPAGAVEVVLSNDRGVPVVGASVRIELPDVPADGLTPRDLLAYVDAKREGDHAETRDPAMFAGVSPLRLAWRDVVDDARSWTRTTDSGGRVIWSGIPAVEGYRWTCLEFSRSTRYEPSVNVEFRKPVHGALVVPNEDHGILQFSGPFAVDRNRTKRLRGTVLRSGTLRGRLALPGLPIGTRVEVYDIRDPELSRRLGYVSLEQESVVETDHGGRFLFAGLRPGLKVVQAVCAIDGIWSFFVQFADLAPGDSVDMGDVTPTDGHSVDVSVSLTGAGPAFATADLAGDLVFSAGDVSGFGGPSHTGGISAKIPLPTDGVMTLRGVPSGRLRVMPQGVRWRNGVKGSVPLRVERLSVSVPEELAVVVEVRVPELFEVPLDVHLPRGVDEATVTAHLSKRGGRAWMQEGLVSASSGFDKRFSVEAGEYELRVMVDAGSREDVIGGFYMRRTVSVSSAAALQVHLARGSAVEFIHGAPRQAVFLSDGPVGFLNSAGEATFGGLEPGMRYRMWNGDVLTAPAAGTTVQVDLTGVQSPGMSQRR